MKNLKNEFSIEELQEREEFAAIIATGEDPKCGYGDGCCGQKVPIDMNNPE